MLFSGLFNKRYDKKTVTAAILKSADLKADVPIKAETATKAWAEVTADITAFKIKIKKLFCKSASVLLGVSLLVTGLPSSAYGDESVKRTWYGISNAGIIREGMQFQDPEFEQDYYWAEDAVYEMAALGMIKGYDSRFWGKDYLTREQALALIYNIAGKEQEAKILAEALNQSRLAGDRKTDARSVWSDGYLALARNDGLITELQYYQAMYSDGESGDVFVRSAPAQRQEVAAWLAKALGLEPSYSQQAIFNFKDWEAIATENIAWVETILNQGIMSGDRDEFGNRYFRPADPIRREEMAQVMKNAEKVFFLALGYEKRTGWVESIEKWVDTSGGSVSFLTRFKIRNSDGQLEEILVDAAIGSAYETREEYAPGYPVESTRDLVVYKDGNLGSSESLTVGDQIEFIGDSEGKVRYVKAESGNQVSYKAVRLDRIDPAARTIQAVLLEKVDAATGEAVENWTVNQPELILKNGEIYRVLENTLPVTYKVSESAKLTINGNTADLAQFQPYSFVILSLNDNLVTGIQTPILDMGREGGTVFGIVEDNNPALGYLSLYDERGSRDETKLQIFYYSDPGKVDVMRDYAPASAEDIQAGDSVFLKTDGEVILSVSAVSNYVKKYGRVLSIRGNLITVEYENGDQQVLELGSDTFVFKNQKSAGINALKEGDRIRLLLQITERMTRLKEITIDGSGLLVSNVYKGTILRMDSGFRSLTVEHLEMLDHGKWTRTDQKGISTLVYTPDCYFYDGDQTVDESRLSRYYAGAEAYIVTEKDFGGREKVVMVSFRSSSDQERLIADSIDSARETTGQIRLERGNQDVRYGPGSIIIKDGRLIQGTNLLASDNIYLVANKDYRTGELKAGVIQVVPGANYLDIYRGRIYEIVENREITVESFSRIEDSEWKFYNTKKTFKIDYNTRILGESGVIGVREFTSQWNNGNLDKAFYILAVEDNAVIISNAPYGAYEVTGEIYNVTEGVEGLEDTGVKDLLQEAGVESDAEGVYQIQIRNVRVYNAEDGTWTRASDTVLVALPSSVFVRNGKVVDAGQLRKGDFVRVFKRNSGAGGIGSIFIAEEK